jgi:large subunit ribosomal protein L13
MANTKTTIERKTHTIDATDQSVGRIASGIVTLLRGKNKPEFLPNVDGGDMVIVENITKLRFTGTKFGQKVYYSFSGYPGGLKETKLSKLFNDRPDEVLRKAVWNMLPKNRLRQEMIKRLTIK